MSGNERFDPETGKKLETVREFQTRWTTLYRGSRGYYIQVINMQCEYPLIPISLRAARRLSKENNEEFLELAFSRIKQVDCQTISTIFFEQTLEDAYDPRREYRIIYET